MKTYSKAIFFTLKDLKILKRDEFITSMDIHEKFDKLCHCSLIISGYINPQFAAFVELSRT